MKIFLGIVVGLVIVISAVIIAGYIYYNDAKDYKKAFSSDVISKKAAVSVNSNPVEKNKTTESSSIEPTAISNEDNAKNELKKENIVNILFLGTDRTVERDETLKIYRSDTIALASINIDTKKVKVLCIPRDTYTFIPIENKKDKINHAYAYGSLKNKAVEASEEAITRFIKYGTIDYYFTMAMEPIPKIVDNIGGVEVDVELDMKTHGANLSKGLQLLDGNKAFDYIHWRYSGNGDIDRMKRQQKFLKLMYNKLKDTSQIIESLKLVLSYNDYISTDMSVKQLIALATLFNDIPSGSMDFQMIPGDSRYINKISYWVPDEGKTDSLLKGFFTP